MSHGALVENHRILIVDDNSDIHADYQRVLNDGHEANSLAAAEAALFGDAPRSPRSQQFELSHAYQGEEAFDLVSRETQCEHPFALAFVDMRMPPGWDGLETIRRLWQLDPRLQVVLCTAYSDYSWFEIAEALSPGDRLLILKKPFDAIEVRQLAASLITKWNLGRAAERSQRDLERQVAERTRELQEAKETADRASQSKSDFLANISHEIRTPLTAILGFTRLLMDGPNAEESTEYLQIIRASAEHQLTLINDLLDVSKIEAGQMPLHRVACSVPRIIDEVLQTLRFRAEEKGLALGSEVAASLAEPIYSDPSRLRQLLLNLVNNALKFTQSGSVHVSAGTLVEDGRRKLRIDVADTGIGIAADKQQMIFDPFVQADSSIAPRFGGTGLGLAISRSIAGLLGGSLTVASHEGRGSTFTLVVDAERPDTADDPAAASPAGGASLPAAGSLEGRRILVVEDHRYNRRLIELAFTRAGALVDMAEDGQAGVDRARSTDYDAVLMDIQMPVMDGYTATEQLRAAGYCKPIIALTAHALPAERQRCLRSGFNAFVGKPIDLDHLKAVVRQVTTRGSPLPDDLFVPDDDFADDESPEERALRREFLASLPETVSDLRGCYALRSFDAMALSAHTLKGAGGTLGFPELSRAGQQLETALNGRRDDLGGLLEQLAALVERLQREALC